MRLLKILLFLIVVAAIGIVGFAFLGDLSPNQSETRIPVDLNDG